MYIKPKTKNKKSTKVIVTIAATILLGLILVFVIMQIVQANKKSIQNNPSQANTTTSTKQNENTNNSTNMPTVEDPKNIKQNEGKNPNDSAQLTGVITAAFLVNGKFSLRTNIDQYVSNGTCTLTMTKGSQNYTATVSLIPNASSSTCQGFDASEAEVGSGTWHVKIDLEGNNRTGTIESEVNL